MDRIESKRRNFELWREGAFGNKLRAWRTVEAWRESGYAGNVVLRYLGVGGGGRCVYDLSPDEVDAEVERWVGDGLERGRIYLNEAMNANTATLQGEYLAGVRVDGSGTAVVEPFLHTFESLHMREALAKSSATSTGLRSRLLLQRYMTPSSYEDFVVLLDRYPGHVIEVSVFARNLGDLPNRNALVWEVRLY